MARKQLSIAQLTRTLHDFLDEVEPNDGTDIPSDPENEIQDFGFNVRTAGMLMAHRGHSDLYEESLKEARELPEFPQFGPVSTRRNAGKFFAKCLAALSKGEARTSTAGETPANSNIPNSLNFQPTKRNPPIRLRTTKRVSPVYVRSYSQYKEAESALGHFIDDWSAYGWLLGRYKKLASFPSWSRYVRGGRRAYDDRKNNPRHGREHGPSIAKQRDI